jgi:hypothetical protein
MMLLTLSLTCMMLGRAIGQAPDNHASHQHVAAPLMVAFTIFRERLMEFRKSQIPHFLRAVEDALAFANESNIGAVAGYGEQDCRNALENCFELAPLLAVAMHGSQKGISEQKM